MRTFIKICVTTTLKTVSVISVNTQIKAPIANEARAFIRYIATVNPTPINAIKNSYVVVHLKCVEISHLTTLEPESPK